MNISRALGPSLPHTAIILIEWKSQYPLYARWGIRALTLRHLSTRASRWSRARSRKISCQFSKNTTTNIQELNSNGGKIALNLKINRRSGNISASQRTKFLDLATSRSCSSKRGPLRSSSGTLSSIKSITSKTHASMSKSRPTVATKMTWRFMPDSSSLNWL